jgi:myo-inositol-1(or 4)-monophosphatase
MQPINVAIEAAHNAGELILKCFRKPQKIEWKGPADIVTQADRDAEEAIVRTIRQAFPDHGFLAEEGHSESQRADYLWVIDPLDGTRNYAAGIPFFCTSIALVLRGQPVLGVIYDPLHRETFSAERGKGTYLNGEKVSFPPKTHLEQARLYFGLPPYKRKDSPGLALPMLVRLYPTLDMVRNSGSAALSLAYVACGRLDISYHDHVNAWDMLAGVLLVQESGGIATEFSGGPISLSSRDVIAANVPAFHAQVLRVAQEVLAERKSDQH